MAMAYYNVEQQEEENVGESPDMEDIMGDALNKKQKNTLPLYGNKDTMNINPMILSNIQGSAYFKEELYKLKTFHEVVDEIFYKVGSYHTSTIISPLLRPLGRTLGAVGKGQQKASWTSWNVWRGKCGRLSVVFRSAPPSSWL